MTRKVTVITGSRAEYGLLKPVMKELLHDSRMKLQLIVTGAHLSAEFGLTYRQIEKDGFGIDRRVEMLMSADTPSAVTKSMGLALIGFGDALQELKPDIVLVLGDRYEIFCAAAAACMHGIPVAHIHGGEVTSGSMDDMFRHAVTKLSHLHFASTPAYRERIIQLGEMPQHVFHTGALGVENILNLELLSREQLQKRLRIDLCSIAMVVAYHPDTMHPEQTRTGFAMLLGVLKEIEDCSMIFSRANADINGRVINSLADDFVRHNDNAVVIDSPGQEVFLSLVKHVDVMVGNSSSGIIEAPSLKTPTVNIGNRQAGRVRAASVIDCPASEDAIREAIDTALSASFRNQAMNAVNPYEKEGCARAIARRIRNCDLESIYQKRFVDQCTTDRSFPGEK
jgi:GDP/UDP-N,N'-diacetylbacillosamine 2-epimerase (hydrolysing)